MVEFIFRNNIITKYENGKFILKIVHIDRYKGKYKTLSYLNTSFCFRTCLGLLNFIRCFKLSIFILTLSTI